MKKKNIFFTFVLGLLLSSCNPYNPSSSGLIDSITPTTDNETTSNQTNSSNSSIMPSTSNNQPLTSSSTTDNTPKERYIYDGYYHWKNSTGEEDKKENYNPHNYEEGKCVDCGYIEVSNDCLIFEAIDEETYGVKKCNREAVEITIPYFYENKKVVAILDKAFYSKCNSLTSIFIPESVTMMVMDSFNPRLNLTNIYYDGTMENWCNIQFAGEYHLFVESYAYHFYMLNQNNIYQEVTKIEIPNTITTIGNDQFCGFKYVTEIIIPNSIISIGIRAFDYCYSLTNVYYEGTIADWCNIQFYGLDSTPMSIASHFYMLDQNNIYQEVTKIEIPNTITKIGDCQFRGFNNITEIIIPSTVTSIGYSAFDRCTSLTSIVIPSSVTYIRRYAFHNCKLLTIYSETESQSSGWDSKWNPNGRPVVWNYAGKHDVYNGLSFAISMKNKNKYITITGYDQSNTDVDIPETIEGIKVTTIADRTFQYCESLTSIVIPSSVVSIGDSAFYACESLANIEIPASVTSIGQSAFMDCDSLTIYCEVESKPSGWEPNWNFDNRPVVWNYAGKHDVYNGLSYAISIKNKNKYITITGYDQSNTDVEIPETIEGIKVTTIADRAFQYCKSLTSIVIPSTVTCIGDYAFQYCESLTSIEIPNSIISIGNYAFYACKFLANIEIPASITSIGKNAFGYCTALTIYCEVESKPSGWDSNWNSSKRPVVWGYKG